mgnify:CR=1 FL=1
MERTCVSGVGKSVGKPSGFLDMATPSEGRDCKAGEPYLHIPAPLSSDCILSLHAFSQSNEAYPLEVVERPSYTVFREGSSRLPPPRVSAL